MKLFIAFIFAIGFISCENNTEETDKEVVSPAEELNNNAIELTKYNNDDSTKKAIQLWNQATVIQKDYYLAFWNKLVFENKLGLKEEAFKTLGNLESLKPNLPEIKSSLGIYYEIKNDTVNAQKKYLEADKLFNSILDTLDTQSDPFQSVLMNKAINLKLLNKQSESNQILNHIKTNQTDKTYIELLDSFIRMDRNQYINLIKQD